MTRPTDWWLLGHSLVFAHVIAPDPVRRLYGRILVPEVVREEL